MPARVTASRGCVEAMNVGICNLVVDHGGADRRLDGLLTSCESPTSASRLEWNGPRHARHQRRPPRLEWNRLRQPATDVGRRAWNGAKGLGGRGLEMRGLEEPSRRVTAD